MRSKKTQTNLLHLPHLPRAHHQPYIYIPPTSYHTHIPSVTRYLLILFVFSNKITALQLDPALHSMQKSKSEAMHGGMTECDE